MQVDEIGGGDLCEMADFRGTSRVEMEGWVAQERVYGVLWGATQLVWTLGRGVARCLGGWRL